MNCPLSPVQERRRTAMTNEQKQDVQWNIRYAQQKLQAIEAGQHADAQTVADRRMYADWQLCRLLHKIAPALPNDLRAEVEACYALRETIWSPFSSHHAHGCDTHASFKVYQPGTPGGYCWYCYVWQQGGSAFDFFALLVPAGCARTVATTASKRV